MDMQSQMTRPYGHEQAEDPIKIHHPEEEEHHEKGASKVLKKVKEKAKKIKNSLTKHGHGHEHDHDVDEDDDEEYEQDPEVHGAPVYESSAVRGGVTGQPDSLTHPSVNTVPAPEEIIPPGTKVFPVVTSDYTKPVEAEPLREMYYGHEALSDPVRTKDTSDREERREAQTRPFGVLSDREESREAHYEPINTATEDVTKTISPGEYEYLGGQRKVNIERPKGLDEDPAAPGEGSDYLSGVSNYQSKVTDPNHKGGGEAGVPEIAESLGRMKVTDESPEKSGIGFGRDLPKRGREFERESESGFFKDSPVVGGWDSRAEQGNEFSSWSYEFDQKNESGIDKNSPTDFGGELGAGLGKEFPAKSHEFDQKNESAIAKDLQTGFSGELGIGLSEVFPAKSSDFDQEIESGTEKNLSTGFGGKPEAGFGEDFQTRSHESDQKNYLTGLTSGSIAGLSEDFPARSHDLGLKNESGIGKDSPKEFGGESETNLGVGFPAELDLKTDSPTTRSHGYSEDSESGRGENIPVRTDDVEVETVLPELSHQVERGEFDSKSEETKPNTYTEKLASATSVITDKAIAAKNAVASKLGYTGESGQHENPTVRDETPISTKGIGYTGESGQHENPTARDETPSGYGQNVVGTVTEKLTPVYEKVKETGSNVLTKLPLSGGGSGADEGKSLSAKDYVAEKLSPGEEDKALSEVIAEKLHLGEKKTKTTTKEIEVTVEKIPTEEIPAEVEDIEEVTKEGGGMVGKIKGWLGGGTTPKSSDSVEESTQSLGSTVGTMGFSDSGSGGGLPGQKGLQ